MDKAKIFKLVWRGWFVGFTVIFVPLCVLVLLIRDVPYEMLFAPLLVPVIAALQGVLAGALVVLGLTIWPPKTSENA